MSSKAIHNPALTKVLRKVNRLPAMPQVAMRILDLMSQDNVAATQIARIIQHDPALTVKMLKVANSSLFGGRRQVSSISQAVVRLGFRTVKLLTLSFSLVDSFSRIASKKFDYDGLRRRSLATAVAARLFAEKMGDVAQDEAFVAGLVADVGVLAVCECAPESYAAVLAASPRDSHELCEAERRILGCTHADLSKIIMTHWNLPPRLCGAVGCHHHLHPEQVDESLRCLTLNLCSAVLVGELFAGDLAAADIDRVIERCGRWTGLSTQELETILPEVDRQIRASADLLEVRVDPGRSYDDIRREATERLAELSVAAEAERTIAAQQVAHARDVIGAPPPESR